MNEENECLISSSVIDLVGREKIDRLTPDEVREIVDEKVEKIAEEMRLRFSMDPRVIDEMSDGGGEFAYYLSALHYVENVCSILKENYIKDLKAKMGTPDGNELSNIMADMAPPSKNIVNKFIVMFIVYGFLKRDIAIKVSQSFYQSAFEPVYS